MSEKKEAGEGKSLIGALVKAQGAFTTVARGAEAQIGTRKFSYAELDDFVEMARPILLKHGLCYMQPVGTDEQGNVTVTTTLYHESGESLPCGSMAIPLQESKLQAYGQTIAYIRRYQLCSALGLVSEGEDRDAGDVQAGPSGSQKAQGTQSGGKAQQKAQEPPVDLYSKEESAKMRDGHLIRLDEMLHENIHALGAWWKKHETEGKEVCRLQPEDNKAVVEKKDEVKAYLVKIADEQKKADAPPPDDKSDIEPF